jgi:hypothetical protein
MGIVARMRLRERMAAPRPLIQLDYNYSVLSGGCLQRALFALWLWEPR